MIVNLPSISHLKKTFSSIEIVIYKLFPTVTPFIGIFKLANADYKCVTTLIFALGFIP